MSYFHWNIKRPSWDIGETSHAPFRGSLMNWLTEQRWHYQSAFLWVSVSNHPMSALAAYHFQQLYTSSEFPAAGQWIYTHKLQKPPIITKKHVLCRIRGLQQVYVHRTSGFKYTENADQYVSTALTLQLKANHKWTNWLSKVKHYYDKTKPQPTNKTYLQLFKVSLDLCTWWDLLLSPHSAKT